MFSAEGVSRKLTLPSRTRPFLRWQLWWHIVLTASFWQLFSVRLISVWQLLLCCSLCNCPILKADIFDSIQFVVIWRLSDIDFICLIDDSQDDIFWKQCCTSLCNCPTSISYVLEANCKWQGFKHCYFATVLLVRPTSWMHSLHLSDIAFICPVDKLQDGIVWNEIRCNHLLVSEAVAQDQAIKQWS